MPKFKLKAGTNTKGVVAYRNKGSSGFKKVALSNPTQAQLAALFALGHPFVVEDKAEKSGGK